MQPSPECVRFSVRPLLVHTGQDLIVVDAACCAQEASLGYSTAV